MSTEPFTHSIDGAVATVRLNRPDLGNKMESHEVAALGRAIRGLGADKAVKIVVVRADGAAL